MARPEGGTFAAQVEPRTSTTSPAREAPGPGFGRACRDLTREFSVTARMPFADRLAFGVLPEVTRYELNGSRRCGIEWLLLDTAGGVTETPISRTDAFLADRSRERLTPLEVGDHVSRRNQRQW